MSEQKKNGIPQMGPDTGNYWCTWDTQFRVNSVEDGKDTKNLRNVLTQDFLFAEDGMLRNYLKKCTPGFVCSVGRRLGRWKGCARKRSSQRIWQSGSGF